PSLWGGPIPSWPCRHWCKYPGFGSPQHRLGLQTHQAERGLSQNSRLPHKNAEYQRVTDHLRCQTLHEHSRRQLFIRERISRAKTDGSSLTKVNLLSLKI